MLSQEHPLKVIIRNVVNITFAFVFRSLKRSFLITFFCARKNPGKKPFLELSTPRGNIAFSEKLE